MKLRHLSLVLCALLLGTAHAASSSAPAGLSSADLQKITRAAQSDYQLIQKLQRLDRERAQKLGEVLSLSVPGQDKDLRPLDNDSCIDSCVASCNGGGGQNACWEACTKQGWGDPSSVCASRCGISSSSGSAACWQTCTKQGWGDPSSVCASRCGISLGGGSAACWQTCSKQGFGDPSSVCAARCGIQTSEGSQACWDVCSKQGFGDPTSVCSARCGTN